MILIKTFKLLILICITALFAVSCDSSNSNSNLTENTNVSVGNTAYYIDPKAGNDSNSGLSPKDPWRTFVRVNKITFSPGDRLEVISPGKFEQTLKLTGSGTKRNPVRVKFAAGRYDFYAKNAIRRKYQISNTNAAPDTPKAIGILFDNAKHFKLSGADADIVYRGKMIEVCVDSSENISISDLSFDYHTPTVAEYAVSEIGDGYVDIEVQADSNYKIEDGKILWYGEGWDFTGGLTQELDLSINEVRRMRDPIKSLVFEGLKPSIIRGRGEHNLRLNCVYQVRNPFRDCAGVFTRRSKDIVWRDVHFKYMHGMGLVNQFSENLTFDRVTIAPDKDSGRTTAAWADCIQISGCRGKIIVNDCVFSGAHDDAINIHGTHLRVIEKIGTNKIKVKFIHKQTYGFLAFNPGDEITFVRWDSLATYAPNKVKDAVLLNPREILLTLESPCPENINENDVVENITWTPEVVIRGCRVKRIPTRGFLITTRRKVVVERNIFHRTHMSAILLEDDAQGWFESGCIRDMKIHNNMFINCAEPVININPRNSVPNDSVHQNIRIKGNEFKLSNRLMVRAKSTKGLKIVDNKIYSKQKLADDGAIEINNCSDVIIENNRYMLIRN